MTDQDKQKEEAPFWPYGLVLVVMFGLAYWWLREGLFYLIGFFVVFYAIIGIASLSKKKS